jgi:Tol biopolymer transport system component
MTARDDFDRHLTTWLDDRAPVREPELLLGQVLARTARTRRRPAWLIPERWIPMSALTSRLATPSRVPWRTVGLAALLIIALVVGAIVIAGSRQRALPPPFGPAANGQIAFSVDGDIVVADTPTSAPRMIIGGKTFDSGPLFSPDGTRMVFVRGEMNTSEAELWTAAADGTGERMIVATPHIGWAEWSPQSDVIAVLIDGEPSKIRLVDTDNGAITEFDTGLAAVEGVIWRPVDGGQLTFRGKEAVGPWGFYVMDRTGGTPRRLGLDPGFEADAFYPENSDYYFVGQTWSADGSRLMYATLEPAPTSTAGPGYRIHVADVDAAGSVTADRIVEFDREADDETAPTWLGSGDDILFQTTEGSQQALWTGSVAASHGPARDLGLTTDGGITVIVSPDGSTVIAAVSSATGGRPAIMTLDLASAAAEQTSFGGDDIVWQRKALP